MKKTPAKKRKISTKKKVKPVKIKNVKKTTPLVKRATRFSPDPMTIGLIDYEAGPDFKPFSSGTLINESYGGCAMILMTSNQIFKGQKIKIKTGNLDPMMAEIVWVETVKDKIYKIGIKYLE